MPNRRKSFKWSNGLTKENLGFMYGEVPDIEIKIIITKFHIKRLAHL